MRCGRLEELEPEVALAVQLAEALTATPARVDDELYARLSEQFPRPALLELATAITWKNYLARFNRLYAVPGDF